MRISLKLVLKRPLISWEKAPDPHYPLSQNDYRQEKIIFELFSGALQENPVIAPGAITGGGSYRTGAHTGDYFLGNSFQGLYRKIL